MLDMPTLKFDKSVKYLEAQINIQKNNKNLLLDIISNIGVILNSSENDTEKLQTILDTANDFLQNISNNITTLEQLHLEIFNITSDLNDIIASKSQGTKTKEYYIAAFSNIKNNIIQYTQNFQNLENKLDIDNNEFNNFIKDNDFKYTFNEVNNQSENSYELESFSVNNESTSISKPSEDLNNFEDDIVDNGIEEAIASQSANKLNNNLVEESIQSNNSTIESVEETISVEDFINISEEPLENNIISNKETLPNIESDNTTITYETNTVSSEETIFNTEENTIEVSDVVDECNITLNEGIDTQTVNIIDENNTSAKNIEENINELTKNFKTLLENFYANKISEAEFNDAIIELQSNISSLNANSDVNKEAAKDINSTSNNEESILSKKNQEQQVENRHRSIEELIQKIKSAEEKNKTLLISEKTNKVYLPYRITELKNYMEYYPKAYKSLSDVVEQEFIINLDTFARHPSKARFSETYNLVRNRSGKSILKAFSYAIKLRNNRKVDPAVIAACKNEYELHCYLYCLEQNKIDSFKFFNIIYDVSLF